MIRPDGGQLLLISGLQMFMELLQADSYFITEETGINLRHTVAFLFLIRRAWLKRRPVSVLQRGRLIIH